VGLVFVTRCPRGRCWRAERVFTESQRVWGWQGPLWVTQPNPLPKQGHPEQAAQHRGQAGLEYLQRSLLAEIFLYIAAVFMWRFLDPM